MINSKSRNEIHEQICKNYDAVQAWFQNQTKKLEYPILYADFYIDGEKVGNVDGGVTYALDAKGGYGIASVMTILPIKSADSVVFNFNGFFEK